MRRLVVLPLLSLFLACKSPLTELPRSEGGPALTLAPVLVEDHSRQLKRLRTVAPGEANVPEARRAALDAQGRWFEQAFKAEGEAVGLRFLPDAPYRLELLVTDLGEVRTRYIVLGIASGVAWGVGTGLVAHNPRLALGLGAYELVEESAFWIGGSSLFSSFSAPAVVEARLFQVGEDKPRWHETYYALSGHTWTKRLPEAARRDRAVQLHASLEKVILKILADLEAIPGFPQQTKVLLTVPAAEPALLQRIQAPDPAPPVTCVTPPEEDAGWFEPESLCPLPVSP